MLVAVGGEVEFEPIRHIVFDQEARLADRRLLRIGIDGDTPRAGRRRGDDGDVERAPAKPLVRHHGAAILDPVRPLDHHGQIDVGNGDAVGVAQQRGHIDGLAGAVDAALGEDEGVERAGRLAARDAAIGQIEGRLREIEEGIVAAVAGGDQHGRR